MKPRPKEKILLIRFSSIGDVAQALSAPAILQELFPQAEVHFLTRHDMADLCHMCTKLHKSFFYNKKSGFKGLWYIINNLADENYTHIYDCHNNLRSNLVTTALWLKALFKGSWINIKHRPTQRWKRFLLLKFKKNIFTNPFNGQMDQLTPLQDWGWNKKLPPTPIFTPRKTVKLPPLPFQNYFCLAPSAAYELKRWPVEYWRQLVLKHTDKNFIVLGGPHDQFTDKISINLPHVLNVSGEMSLEQSTLLIAQSQGLIANDTGIMHIAEQLGKPTVAFMGPAPFGFPARLEQTLILQNNSLHCRPCSKHGQGPCVNTHFQECLKSISPSHPDLEKWIEKNWVSSSDT